MLRSNRVLYPRDPGNSFERPTLRHGDNAHHRAMGGSGWVEFDCRDLLL